MIATRGCVDGRNGSYKLGEEYIPTPTEGGGGIRQLTLGGQFAAYEKFVSGTNRYMNTEGTTEWRVVVRDLRTGRALHDVPTGTPNPPNPKHIGDGETTVIVVKSDGAVAWITDTVQSADRYQVHAVDASGERMLASGSDIDPHSLALAGSTLYWTDGGKAFSTVLR